MITAIIAGGSGTRLWPLSTPEYPKHLLRVNGDKLSLLQATYERAKKISNDVYVVSDKSHAHHVRDQLPNVDEAHLVVEPARRGTGSCIVALLSHIAKTQPNKKEPIAILSADHYIRDIEGFHRSFQVGGKIAARNDGSIVLVGVEPDYPATGFGYIKKGELFNEHELIFKVDEFKEKPDYKTAQNYLKSGEYLWNCGYFIATLDGFEKNMREFAPRLYKNYVKLQKLTQSQYEKAYLEFENISIDYALIEKAKNLLVIPANFDWMDLGSFTDLHKAVTSDELGNHVHGENIELEQVENSFIQNHEEKPIAVIGLDNIVVVNTPHGIVVARKDLSQKVGEVSKKFDK